MDKTQRYIASELAHRVGVRLVGEAHELYLVAYKQAGGLTDTEKKYLMSIHSEMEKQQQRLHKLTGRLRG